MENKTSANRLENSAREGLGGFRGLGFRGFRGFWGVLGFGLIVSQG